STDPGGRPTTELIEWNSFELRMCAPALPREGQEGRREAVGGGGIGPEVEHGLDQLQLHEDELPGALHSVHPRVEAGSGRRGQGPGRLLDQPGARIRGLRPPSQLLPATELARPATLAHRVACRT